MSTLPSRTERRPLLFPAGERPSTWRPAILWGLSAFSLPIVGYVANLLAGSVDGPASGALAGTIAGTGLGAAQWLVLRSRLRQSGSWIPATAIGFAAGLAAGTAAVGARTGIVDLVISGAITGAAIGVAQFLVLRESSKLATLWIPIMAASWPIGWAVTWAARIDVDKGWANFGSSGVIVFGLLTAIALFVAPGILRGPKRELA